MKTRLMMFAIASLVMLSGCTTGSQTGIREAVKPPEGGLAVTVREDALEPTSVATATVSLDSSATTTAASPVFEHLSPGPHKLRVEAPNHETLDTTVTVTSGRSSYVATVSLTPIETYVRFNKANQFGRMAFAYKYLHPDVRKAVPFDKFDKGMSQMSTMQMTFGDTRVLPRWRSPLTKKTYMDVTEIDRMYVGQVKATGQTLTDNGTQHWLKMGGRWFIVYAKW